MSAGAGASAATLPSHAHGRKATWFELFFDLVFVVAVAELSAAYAHHYDVAGGAGFAFAFLAMWWCWLGHTFHATRFDEERPAQRALGFAQVLAVALIGYGAAAPFGERAVAFACGVAAFKALLAVAYAGEWRWSGARALIGAYATVYVAQALLWLGGLAFPMPGRIALWALALVLDLLSPWWVARHTTAVPPHPEHLPERFGLFTIILLGEGMAAVVHALGHGAVLDMNAVLVAAGGAVVIFLFWIGYFDRVRGQAERRVGDARAGRHLRLWAYAHVPLYLGIASLAAGTVALSGQPELQPAPALLYAGGIALAMLGVSALGLAGAAGPTPQARRQAATHGVVALLFVAAVVGAVAVGLRHTPVPVGVAIVACVLQIAMSRRRAPG